MKLNTLKPQRNSKFKKKRFARGISGKGGKTAGRGHKGQKSRAGFSKKRNFEGGQMPLQRRVPKQGFLSRKSLSKEVIRLNTLLKIKEENIDINILKQYKIIKNSTKNVKIILDKYSYDKFNKKIILKNILVTKSVKEKIISCGGQVYTTSK